MVTEGLLIVGVLPTSRALKDDAESMLCMGGLWGACWLASPLLLTWSSCRSGVKGGVDAAAGNSGRGLPAVCICPAPARAGLAGLAPACPGYSESCEARALSCCKTLSSRCLSCLSRQSLSACSSLSPRPACCLLNAAAEGSVLQSTPCFPLKSLRTHVSSLLNRPSHCAARPCAGPAVPSSPQEASSPEHGTSTHARGTSSFQHLHDHSSTRYS